MYPVSLAGHAFNLSGCASGASFSSSVHRFGRQASPRRGPAARPALTEAFRRESDRAQESAQAPSTPRRGSGCAVQLKRNKHAALKLMRKLLRKYAVAPERLVTDDLRSYGAATLELGIDHLHDRGRWKNNRAENSHQPTRRRERKMQRFKSAGSAQKFPSTDAAAYNTFNVHRHLTSAQSHRVLRAAAMTTWREAVAAA